MIRAIKNPRETRSGDVTASSWRPGAPFRRRWHLGKGFAPHVAGPVSPRKDGTEKETVVCVNGSWFVRPKRSGWVKGHVEM